MVTDPVLYYTDVSWKIGWTLRIIRVEIKERITDGSKSASAQRPVDNTVLLICRIHVVDILGIIYSADRFTHADKLTRLSQDVSDIASLIDSGKFPIGNVGPVHDDRGNCSHSVDTSIMPAKPAPPQVPVTISLQRVFVLWTQFRKTKKYKDNYLNILALPKSEC
jgi:hypothetical protein